MNFCWLSFQLREGFQAIEQCAAEAGEDLESLLSCKKGFIGAWLSRDDQYINYIYRPLWRRKKNKECI